MYQDVSLRVDARQWLRTYSGQRPGETSGAYNRSLCYLMAVGHGKDADRRAKAGQPPAPGAARGGPELAPAVCPRVAPARPRRYPRPEPTEMQAMPSARLPGCAARGPGLSAMSSHVPGMYFPYAFHLPLIDLPVSGGPDVHP
jgi:hypothetical protein